MNSAVSVQSAEDVDPFEGYEPIISWADYMDKAEAEGYIDPRPLKIPSWAVLDFPMLAEDLKTSPAVPATGQETRLSSTWHGVSEEKKSKRQRNRKPFAQNKTWGGQEMATNSPTRSAPAPAPQYKHPDSQSFRKKDSSFKAAGPPQCNPPASKPPPDVSKFEFKLPPTFAFAQNKTWGGQETDTISPTTSAPAPAPQNHTLTLFQRNYWTFPESPMSAVFGSAKRQREPDTSTDGLCRLLDGLRLNTEAPTTSTPAPVHQCNPPASKPPPDVSKFEFKLPPTFGSAKRQREPDTSTDGLCRLLDGLRLNTEAPTTSTPAPVAQCNPPVSKPPPDVSKFEFKLPPTFAFAQNKTRGGQEMATKLPTTSAPAPAPQKLTLFQRDYWTFSESPMSAVFGSAKRQIETCNICIEEMRRQLERLDLSEPPATPIPAPVHQCNPPASKPPPDVSKFEFKLPPTFAFAQNKTLGGQEMTTNSPTTTAPAPAPQRHPPASKPLSDVSKFEFKLPPTFTFAQNETWGGQEMPTILPTTSAPAPVPQCNPHPPDVSKFQFELPLTLAFAQNKSWGGQEMATNPPTTSAPAPQPNASQPPPDVSNFEVRLPPTFGSAKRQQKPDTSFNELCRVLDGLEVYTNHPTTYRPVTQRYHHHLRRFRKQDPSYKASGPPQRTYPYSQSSRKQHPSFKAADLLQCNPPSPDVSNFELKWRHTFAFAQNKTRGGQEILTNAPTTTAPAPAPQPPASKPPTDMSNFEVRLPPTFGSAKRQRKPDTSFDELCRVLDGLEVYTKAPATSRPVAQRYHPYLQVSRKQDSSSKTADPPQCNPPSPDVSNFELKLPLTFEFEQNKTLGVQEMPTNPLTTTAPAPVPRRYHPFSRSLKNQEPSVKAPYQHQRYHPYLRPSRKRDRSVKAACQPQCSHPYLRSSKKEDPSFKAADPPKRYHPYSRSFRKQDPSVKAAYQPQRYHPYLRHSKKQDRS